MSDNLMPYAEAKWINAKIPDPTPRHQRKVGTLEEILRTMWFQARHLILGPVNLGHLHLYTNTPAHDRCEICGIDPATARQRNVCPVCLTPHGANTEYLTLHLWKAHRVGPRPEGWSAESYR